MNERTPQYARRRGNRRQRRAVSIHTGAVAPRRGRHNTRLALFVHGRELAQSSPWDFFYEVGALASTGLAAWLRDVRFGRGGTVSFESLPSEF